MRQATTLAEKYRPRRLEQIRGHDGVMNKVRRIVDRPGFDGGLFLFSGGTGTGKTCFARALSQRVGVRVGAWNYEEIDGDKCSVDTVRELDAHAQVARLFSDEWRFFIVNECHLMSDRACGAWLTLAERWPYHWLAVFTTTEDVVGLFGPMGKPFYDRTIGFRLSNQGLAMPFARLAHGIARREGMNGVPLSRYVNAIKRAGIKNSMRAMLAAVQRGDFLAGESADDET